MDGAGPDDRATIDIYEAGADEWARGRTTEDPGPAGRLGDRLPGPARTADLGCGPGLYLRHLPDGAIGIDATAAMLELARAANPHVPLVRADVARLPLRTAGLDGAVASKVHIHLGRGRVPEALAELHRVLAVGAPAELVMFGGDDTDLEELRGGRLPGRRFTRWTEPALADVLVGAGFGVERFDIVEAGAWPRHEIGVVRERTLPDRVAPRMRLLVCGLNPSIHAADAGVGFARPGNRFWPAALAAGLVTVDRDPRHALDAHGVGMTDLVKRATARADELDRAEYEAGLGRVERLCAWLEPAAVCMVGLAGWRAAVDRRAVAGWQERRLGGRPVYVMPSTSGLNAHSRLDDLTEHLRTAAAGVDG